MAKRTIGGFVDRFGGIWGGLWTVDSLDCAAMDLRFPQHAPFSGLYREPPRPDSDPFAYLNCVGGTRLGSAARCASELDERCPGFAPWRPLYRDDA